MTSILFPSRSMMKAPKYDVIVAARSAGAPSSRAPSPQCQSMEDLYRFAIGGTQANMCARIVGRHEMRPAVESELRISLSKPDRRLPRNQTAKPNGRKNGIIKFACRSQIAHRDKNMINHRSIMRAACAVSRQSVPQAKWPESPQSGHSLYFHFSTQSGPSYLSAHSRVAVLPYGASPLRDRRLPANAGQCDCGAGSREASRRVAAPTELVIRKELATLAGRHL
jgi:hypothetical protein